VAVFEGVIEISKRKIGEITNKIPNPNFQIPLRAEYSTRKGTQCETNKSQYPNSNDRNRGYFGHLDIEI
jgi:hypothetical protein